MDISVPELNGLEEIRQLRALCPEVKVIGMAMSSDPRYVRSLFEAGASGYLLMVNDSASEELILAVNTVVSGIEYVSPALMDRVLDRCVRQTESASLPSGESRRMSPVPKALSPRECEVLRLVAEGRSSKDIAVCLDIAITTVDTHRRQLMAKLNIRTIAALTKYAIRAGLTSLE